ncbi:MAG: TonB-dependent receptor [Saprospiraceae bacterium]|nr:TonB-dependent receptor [Saprospiraceae bacterium]
MIRLKIRCLCILALVLFAVEGWTQNKIQGIVLDAVNNDPIIGANIVIEGTSEGTISDWDGSYSFTTSQSFPISLEISYIGYENELVLMDDNKRLTITMNESSILIDAVEVKGSRIADKQKESPLTIESLDIIAIKETPAADFYDGLGALKGVDLTAASLGFKVVNTRGFNSTSPVRSLQIIDGVDNQAPGLNFSLGNFLGTSELDINKVELIVGASSAFYGPNAFNGVISMETRDPFFHTGLSAMVKGGERNLFKTAVRYANSIANKEGNDVFAYKFNLEYLRADDWEADNYGPIDDSSVSADNPGRYDAVNIYGDEYQRGNDYSSFPLFQYPGLGTWYRTGYREIDLVDYDTRNLKANAAFHFRTNPSLAEQSPELIIGSSYGSGTTVYQGDNRFSLKGITFLQNKIEYRKRNKFFIRAYSTRTGAGDSYDPYFTALQLQENAKGNTEWSIDYADYWISEIVPLIAADETFPKLSVMIDPVTGQIITEFDIDAANQWIIDNNSLLSDYHSQAEDFANNTIQGSSQSVPFFEPGTQRFEDEFNRITTSLRSDGGTQFFDNSSLYHVHGEYTFTPTFMDKIVVGSNYRLYRPESQGTVFSDTANIQITNSEFGMYTGLEKSFADNKLKASAAIRADKNKNFDWLFSPAASLVYTPSPNNFLRLSFSSAIRNPTLTDQYLYLDVGRATLSGNLNGANNLITIESLVDYFDTQNSDTLVYFDIDPIRPEEVKTFELGYRTTLFEKLYLDAGYYYSIYDNFIGFNIGVIAEFDQLGFPVGGVEAFRYSANSNNTVTTQGFSFGFNYYLAGNYTINGNYSWIKLNTDVVDNIIPAFNTPEHKYNLGFAGRNLSIGGIKNVGFNINYKWIEGFIFEGSPQFTGFVPTYDMLDAQVNFGFTKINTTLKIGASNILDKQNFQTFGGPRIGRLAYVMLTYEPSK